MNKLLLGLCIMHTNYTYSLPNCSNSYRGTRHDAEWSSITKAFHSAISIVSGVPMSLAVAIGIIESGLNQHRISNKGAIGVMQVTGRAERHVHMLSLPGVAANNSSKNKHNIQGIHKSRCIYNCRYNLEDNIIIGMKYLKFSIDSTDTLEEALIMYNGGYRALRRWRKGLTVPLETKEYVIKVLAKYKECNQ